MNLSVNAYSTYTSSQYAGSRLLKIEASNGPHTVHH